MAWEEAESSDTAKSGTYVLTIASRFSLPISASRIMAVPVKVLVIEPIWSSVSSVIGSGLLHVDHPIPSCDRFAPVQGTYNKSRDIVFSHELFTNSPRLSRFAEWSAFISSTP